MFLFLLESFSYEFLKVYILLVLLIIQITLIHDFKLDFLSITVSSIRFSPPLLPSLFTMEFSTSNMTPIACHHDIKLNSTKYPRPRLSTPLWTVSISPVSPFLLIFPTHVRGFQLTNTSVQNWHVKYLIWSVYSLQNSALR